jgi:hypothetical protein
MDFKIWGLNWTDEIRDGQMFWKTELKQPPFWYNGHLTIGISEKSILAAQQAGVSQFIIKFGDKEYTISVPKKKTLRQKKKDGMIEYRKSLFEGSPDMPIYYFNV